MQKGDTEGELAFTKRLLTGFCSGLVLSSFAKVIGVVRDYLLLFLLGAGMQTDALFAAGAGSAVVWYGLTVGIGTSVFTGVCHNIEKESRECFTVGQCTFCVDYYQRWRFCWSNIYFIT